MYIYIYIYILHICILVDIYISAGPPLGGATRLRSALSSQTVTFLNLIISLSVSCESYCHLISQLLLDSRAQKFQITFDLGRDLDPGS